MVVVSHEPVDNLVVHDDVNACKSPCHHDDHLTVIPVVDLSDPNAQAQIARACLEFGFFKVTNHGVPDDFLGRLEQETLNFFQLPHHEKTNSGPSSPLGYGNKNIGSNGDVGWVEYLLFTTNPHLTPPNSILPGISKTLWSGMNKYIECVRKMTCGVLEMIADELKIEPRDKLSEMIRDEHSDSCFRVNYYPACPDLDQTLIGFGEHTDPQIMSVIKSNNTSGLQISLNDGTWISVPPDRTTFFFMVGDSLQVMTNGRYKSVRHRVFVDSVESRVSMIYFGGPTMDEEIKPLVTMKKGEESAYKEFTWTEYKTSAYKTRLSDNRLALFEKSIK